MHDSQRRDATHGSEISHDPIATVSLEIVNRSGQVRVAIGRYHEKMRLTNTTSANLRLISKSSSQIFKH